MLMHLFSIFSPSFFLLELGIQILEIAATKIQKIARGRMGRNYVAKLLSKKKKNKKGAKGGKKKKLV
jgi:hypothetical protein